MEKFPYCPTWDSRRNCLAMLEAAELVQCYVTSGWSFYSAWDNAISGQFESLNCSNPESWEALLLYIRGLETIPPFCPVSQLMCRWGFRNNAVRYHQNRQAKGRAGDQITFRLASWKQLLERGYQENLGNDCILWSNIRQLRDEWRWINFTARRMRTKHGPSKQQDWSREERQ